MDLGWIQKKIEDNLVLILHAVNKYERGDASFTSDIIEMFTTYYRVPKWIPYNQIPNESWYDIYDIAYFKIFQELSLAVNFPKPVTREKIMYYPVLPD